VTLTTTTAAPGVASCPDPTPLFSFAPTPADAKIVLTPAGPQPPQTLVYADCLANTNPAVTDTVVLITLDSGGGQQTQNMNKFPTPSQNFERIYLLCQPSGDWLALTDIGPPGGDFGWIGTVSVPGNIVCKG
jgi:hypothetical protein